MKHHARMIGRTLVAGSTMFCATSMMAQETSVQAAGNTDDDIVYLSPFEVTSEGSIGYQARDTLAGTRLRTDLKDVANAVQVINSQFLEDIGATDTKSLLVYTTNTEVGGIGGNYAGTGDGTNQFDTANRVSPQTNTRVRGLAAADNTRNFFLTRTPWDGYNVDRVDISRGANSILFGIGSPAGIVNTNVQGASLFNEGKIETRLGSYGSIRGSVNVNRVILDGELAVRVAGLYDNEKFRQKPAFDKDERVFAAVRYDPKWAEIGGTKLSVKVNYENGDIEANRPRINPPTDRITPWFTHMGQATFDGSIVNSSNRTEYETSYLGNPSYGALNATFGDGTPNPNYQPYASYWGGNFYGPVVVYDDPGSSTQSMIMTGQFTSVTGTSANGSPLNLWGAGVDTTSLYAKKVHLVGSTIGGWKDFQISDPDVFDYYNNLLDGDTKRELEEWEAFNGTVTETFFDGIAGVEFAYDYQSDKQTYKSRLRNAGYQISVDTARFLADGSPNPNTGRAYVGTTSDSSYSNKETRRTLRGTAFVEFDAKKYFDRDSLLVRIIGRHVLQANYSRMTVNIQNRGWMGLTAGPGYNDGLSIAEGARTVGTISYLSDSLLGKSLDNINISRIKGARNPVNGNINLYLSPDGTYGSAGAGYVSTPITIWSDANKEDMKNLYAGNQCSDSKNVTDSWGVVWNGYMMDSLIVPTLGYRHDKQEQFNTGAANLERVPGVSNQGIANFDHPLWFVPKNGKNLVGNQTYMSESGSSTSWGVVVHMPEFIKKHLPMGLDLSVFYNKSDNFQPMAGRTDVYGDPVSSPKGDTKDYGFVISALDNRITFKVNWYKTSVTDASLDTAIPNSYMLGYGEGWGYQNLMWASYRVKTPLGQPWIDYSVDQAAHAGSPLSEFCPWTLDTYSGDVTYDDTLARFKECYRLMNDPEYQPGDKFTRAWLGTTFSEYAAKVGSSIDHKEQIMASANTPNGLSVTGDTESKGIEFELTAQITPNWNVALNVSKTEAMRMNLATTYAEFVERRAEVYATPYGDARLWGPGGGAGNTLRDKWMTEFYGNYRLQRALEGSDVAELCPWRANLVTNYSFTEGLLQGVNIGGGYRWSDKVTIGYPVLTAADGKESYDIDHPYKGPTESNLDAWIGYEHKINDDVTWRIQLNVRNLFADDDLIPVTCQPDGTPNAYRIPDSTTWYLTNTFTF